MTVPRLFLQHVRLIVAAALLLAAAAPPSAAARVSLDKPYNPESNPEFASSAAAARQAFEDADFRMAADLFERALANASDSANQRRLAEYASEAERLGRRKGDILAALPPSPQQRSAVLLDRYERGRAAYRSGDLETARENLEFAWMGGPIEDSFFILEEIEQAVAARRANAAGNAQQAQELAEMARASKSAGRDREAATLMAQAAALAPNNGALNAEARQYQSAIGPAAPMRSEMGRGDMDNGADAMSDAGGMATDDRARLAEVDENLARAEDAMSQGYFENAEDYYRRALRADPNNRGAQAGLQAALDAQAAARPSKPMMDDGMGMADDGMGAMDDGYEAGMGMADDGMGMADDGMGMMDDGMGAGSAMAGSALDSKMDNAEALYQRGNAAWSAGNYAEAHSFYAQAALRDPQNPKYQRDRDRAEKRMNAQLDAQSARIAAENMREAKKLYNEGVNANYAGDLAEARRLWELAVEISPEDYREPRVSLAETADEWEIFKAERDRESAQRSAEEDAKKKLNELVTISTARATELADFLDTLSLLTEINYSIEAGVDAQIGVNVKFEQQRVSDVLDHVLLPNGLRWERRGDVIIITADLTTEVFSLSGDQARKVRVLVDSGELERLMHPPGSMRVAGTDLRLDDRRNLLIVTDSFRNIDRLEKILVNLDKETPPETIFRTFTIRERQGPELKALLESVLKVGSNSSLALDRRILLEGDTLIIQDTPENIARAEEILLDRGFLKNLGEGRLGIATFSLLPRQALMENTEQLRAFAENVVEVIQTFLYADSGREAAARQGRRLWFDPALLQVTIVDTESNLREVADFVASLQVLQQEERFELIILRHASAEELSSELDTFLGLSSDGTGGGSDGESVTRSVSVDSELTFRDLQIRVTRVNENDVNDENDDSVELVARTNTESRDMTIEEFRSEFIGDFEVTALDVRPSSTVGEGRARLEIRFVPSTTGNNQQGGAGAFGGAAAGQPAVAAGQPGAGQPGAATTPAALAALEAQERARNITITPVESLNALLIRFRDVSLYNRVRDIIEELDIPVLQVSIGTNFVEVNETRAKEYGSEFALNDILNDDFDFTSGDLNFGFGRDANEVRSVFEPPIEYGYSASLLKGASVISFDFGVLSGNLRMMEAEGILNVVTGPQVTVLNGDSAEFRIALAGGVAGTNSAGGTGTGTGTNTGTNTGNTNTGNTNTGNTNTGNTNTNTNTGTNTGTTGTQGQQGGSAVGGAVANLDLVDLEVSPTITQLGSITLDLSVDINEFVTDTADTLISSDNTDPFAPRNVGNNTSFGVQIKRKELVTRARVNDGGTIVLGGFSGERSRDLSSGIPVLRNLPYVGKVLFGRNLKVVDKTTLLIFLNANIIE